MLRPEDELRPFLFLGVLVFMTALILGTVIGSISGEQRATKETTISCIEQPKECKIKYDFYTLENTK